MQRATTGTEPALDTDTIVAVVTPPGEGGVGIVRVSGALSRTLPGRLFPAVKGPWHSHRLRHGTVIDPANGAQIDDALGCVMRAPRSYTGEDVFEIHCHGSPLVLERIVDSCLQLGCRPARPGEFTLRAFLHGRLDLTQAEAVVDVVRARSNAALELAVRQLNGWLGDRIAPLYDALLGVLARLEASIDFVEEDVPPELDPSSHQRLRAILCDLNTLLAGAREGMVLREGATLCIAGSPNVGKSSIMNALLGAERSIVTPVPGTTRDTVAETLQIRGIPFRAVDTAGVRMTQDVVERIGIDRSRQTLESADVVLLVLDRSRQLSPDDELLLSTVENVGVDPGRIVVALNKADLTQVLDASPVVERLGPRTVVESSTVATGGMDEVRAALEEAAVGGARQEHVVGNVRHIDALRRASVAIASALDAIDAGVPLDLVSFDIRAAAHALGEIIGAGVDDELLDRIFRDFCIGK